MPKALLSTVLEVSVAVSPLIAILLPLTPHISRRYSGRLPSLLWLMLTLRLLVPLNVTGGPLNLPLPGEGRAIAGQAGELALYELPVAMDTPARMAVPAADLLPIPQLLAGLWLAGAAALLLWHLAAYLHTCRRLRRWRLPASPGDGALLQSSTEALGIRRTVRLYRSSVATGPLLIGFARPCIILPDVPFTDGQLRDIFRHELFHLRRGDLWYKLLLLLAAALHWFNPLVHILARRADADLELACDSDALHGSGPEDRGRYGETVLHSLVGKAPGTPLTTCLAGRHRQLKRRFTGIMDTSPKKRGFLPLLLLLTAVIACSGLVACGTAQPESTEASPVTPLARTDAVWSWPAPGHKNVSSPYGERNENDFHTGADFSDDSILGANVAAANAGTVAFVNEEYTEGVGYGKYILIDHGGEVSTLYAHLDTVRVRAGDAVAAGDQIATVGRTGYTQQPNLHFEVRENGVAVDPAGYLPYVRVVPIAFPETNEAFAEEAFDEAEGEPDTLAEEPGDPEMGFIWPTNGGVATTSKNHTGMGVDIEPGGAGHPIYAVADGVVTKVVNGYTGYGHYIMLDHGNGFQTLYAHNSENFVVVGENVTQGEVIGSIGRTGWAEGYHLHFEVRLNGKYFDPRDYIGDRG